MPDQRQAHVAKLRAELEALTRETDQYRAAVNGAATLTAAPSYGGPTLQVMAHELDAVLTHCLGALEAIEQGVGPEGPAGTAVAADRPPGATAQVDQALGKANIVLRRLQELRERIGML